MRIVPVITGLLAALTCAPALAASFCGERDMVIERLAKMYAEKTVAQALTSDGKLVEVLTSSAKDTWTILVTLPTGSTCALAEGRHWHQVDAGPRPDLDEPST